MNSEEKEGLIDILKSLNPRDLFSIVDTTTKHMVKAESAEEAIRIILTYSDNASTLLRRKKIKKQTLFNYLRCHSIPVSINGEKIDYIKACLQLWNSDYVNKVSSFNDIEESQDKHSENAEQAQQLPLAIITEEGIRLLGIQFSSWFFENLNALQDFGPQHFWPDCKLWLHLKASGTKDEEFCITGSDSVSSYLTSYIVHKKYFFKLNVNTDAITSKQEQHGLVKVCASGIVHQMTNCIGLFDINFGLVSDPMNQYTWKIKVIYLALHINSSSGIAVSSPSSVPYLCQ